MESLNSFELQKNLEFRQHVTENMTIYAEAKVKVQAIINSFKKLEKRAKKTKQSREAMRLMEDFVKCNLTSPSISIKYKKVIEFLSRFSKPESVNNADKTPSNSGT